MVRILTALTAALLLAVAPATAQDGSLERREVLAHRYVDLMQTDSFGKIVSAMLEQELANDGDTPEEVRAFVREQGPIFMTRMVEQMMAELVPVYARAFTEDELEALVAFYETPMGQSIARKDIELGVETEEIMTRAVAQMALDFFAKYCAAFECPDGEADFAEGGDTAAKD